MRLLSILTFLVVSQAWAKNVDLSPLSREQRQKVYQGELVMLSHPVEGATWPRLEAFVLVKADAEELAAFFADFEAQPQYVPELLKAKIVDETNPLDVHVAYEMHMPWPLSNAVYIHGHRLSREGEKQFKVEWYKIKSSVTEKLSGHADFIGEGDKTLWHYVTHVQPKSMLGGFFESRMKSDSLKTLQITLDTFKQWRAKKPELLANSLKLWRARFHNSTK